MYVRVPFLKPKVVLSCLFKSQKNMKITVNAEENKLYDDRRSHTEIQHSLRRLFYAWEVWRKDTFVTDCVASSHNDILKFLELSCKSDTNQYPV